MVAISVTANIAHFIDKKGINLANLARSTNIPYMSLYASLGNHSNVVRELKATELIEVCDFLNINPMDYSDKNYATNQ